jgi:S1-C subfamily serine protease
MKKKITLIIGIVFVLGLMSCQFTPNLNLVQTTQNPALVQPTLTSSSDIPSVLPVGSELTSDQVLTALYDQVNPGVVTIISTTSQGVGSGSGFVIDKEGHILTNYHVVDTATQVEVDFPSGEKVTGDVVATDLDSDVAVVKVDVPSDILVPLRLGDSDSLKVGQMVVAIGNPFRLSNTMTLGIVSAKGRVLDSIRTTSDQGSYSAGDLIQTDASINPGNSGGPLLNLNGEVVGINRAIQTTGTSVQGEAVNSGIGFAVSINIVKRVVPVLIKDGSYDYPYMGISSSSMDFTLDEWKALGLTQTSGAYILNVTPGGPAEKAGLVGGTKPTSINGLYAGGDLIVAVDGKPVLIYGDIISYIFLHKSPGDTIVLTVIRNGVEKEVPLVLGKRP